MPEIPELKTYAELQKRTAFLSRFRYLVLGGTLGAATFGFDRHFNQAFYGSQRWKSVRDEVIIRDDGCDMGLPGHAIFDRVLVHHMNPIRVQDLIEFNEDALLNTEHLICVSPQTHNAIHFGDERQLPRPLVERKPGDTDLW